MNGIIIESAPNARSAPTGVSFLKRCGRLKFVSSTLDIQVYQDGSDAIIKANAIQFPPAPNPAPVMPPLELIRENGVIILRTTPNARVVLNKRDGQQFTGMTDENGDIELTQFPAGAYSITINDSLPIRTIIGSKSIEPPGVILDWTDETNYSITGVANRIGSSMRLTNDEDINLINETPDVGMPMRFTFTYENTETVLPSGSYKLIEVYRDGTESRPRLISF